MKPSQPDRGAVTVSIMSEYFPIFVKIISAINFFVFFSVTITTKQFEVVKVQSDVRIIDVVWCQMDFMMNNLARVDQTMRPTAFTQTTD